MMKRQRAAQRSQQHSQQRQPTPMEIDSSPIASKSFSLPGISVSSAEPSGDKSNWIYRNDIDLIEKTVEDFRLQRLSMVQSLRQFVLCYETVLEWLSDQTPKSA
jgi:protein-tyrosine phosphatase